MSSIDPNSPSQWGTDFDGAMVELGETTEHGMFVGYIDEDGQPWEDARQAQIMRCVQNFVRAFNRANRSGGALEAFPQADRFAAANCDEENAAEAAHWCREAISIERQTLAPYRAAASQLN